jgi:hypothetical protein
VPLIAGIEKESVATSTDIDNLREFSWRQKRTIESVNGRKLILIAEMIGSGFVGNRDVREAAQ